MGNVEKGEVEKILFFLDFSIMLFMDDEFIFKEVRKKLDGAGACASLCIYQEALCEYPESSVLILDYIIFLIRDIRPIRFDEINNYMQRLFKYNHKNYFAWNLIHANLNLSYSSSSKFFGKISFVEHKKLLNFYLALNDIEDFFYIEAIADIACYSDKFSNGVLSILKKRLSLLEKNRKVKNKDSLREYRDNKISHLRYWNIFGAIILMHVRYGRNSDAVRLLSKAFKEHYLSTLDFLGHLQSATFLSVGSNEIIMLLRKALTDFSFDLNNLPYFADLFLSYGDYSFAIKLEDELIALDKRRLSSASSDFIFNDSVQIKSLCRCLSAMREKEPFYQLLSPSVKEIVDRYKGGSVSKKVISELNSKIRVMICDPFLFKKTISTFSRQTILEVFPSLGDMVERLFDQEGNFKVKSQKELRVFNALLMENRYKFSTKLNIQERIFQSNIYRHYAAAKIEIDKEEWNLALENLEKVKAYYNKIRICSPVLMPGDNIYSHYSVDRLLGEVDMLILKIRLFFRLKRLFGLEDLMLIYEDVSRLANEDLKVIYQEERKFHETGYLILEGDLIYLLDTYLHMIQFSVYIMNTAFSFQDIDLSKMDNVYQKLLESGMLETKKFLDSIVSFCFKLQRYSCLEDAMKYQDDILKEFSKLNNSHQSVLDAIDMRLKQFSNVIREDINEARKEIKTLVKQPIESSYYMVDYVVVIAQDRGRKGTLFVTCKRGVSALPLTEVQVLLLMALAERLKSDKNLSSDKRGVMTFSEIKDGVAVWGATTQDDQIRKQVGKIRELLKSKSLDKNFIQTYKRIGYRISTHPDNIEIR